MGFMRVFGLIFFMTLLIGGCIIAVSGSPPNPPPVSRAPKEVSWDEAIDLLYNGRVKSVAQTPNLRVHLLLTDGSRVITIEPQIDAIYSAIKQCGDVCRALGTVSA